MLSSWKPTDRGRHRSLFWHTRYRTNPLSLGCPSFMGMSLWKLVCSH